MHNIVMLDANSYRGTEWADFAVGVLDHIQTYSITQYSDGPDDQAGGWSVDDCVKQILKYMTRFGQNAREGQQCLDFIKVAHYCALAYFKQEKLEKEEKTEDNYEKELHNELIAYLLTEKDGKGVEKNAEDIIQIMKDKVRGRGGF